MVPNTKSPVVVLTWPPPSLATRGLGHIDAPGGLGHDLVGILVAGEEKGIGHPHHGQVLVGLAPPVARGHPTLLAGPEVVPQVVGEHAVVDEDVALGRPALVVDGEGPPLGPHRPVIDQGDQGAGHQLADPAGVHRGVLDDVVRLEPMAAGLVEEDAATAPGQDHRQLTGRSRAGP